MAWAGHNMAWIMKADRIAKVHFCRDSFMEQIKLESNTKSFLMLIHIMHNFEAQLNDKSMTFLLFLKRCLCIH